MNIRACIFDLDGVLVDTAHFHYLAWKTIAEKLHIRFTLEDNERLKGVSRMDSLNIILEIGNVRLSDEEKERLATEKNGLYLDFILKMTPADVLPGVTLFLKELKKAAILTALGSASKNARTILQRVDLIKELDAIVDGNIVSKAKPDPQVFAKGAEMLGIDPENCIVFEDAIAGIESAHRAGMKCIGVGSPLILCKADFSIDGFKNFTIENLLSINWNKNLK